MLDAAAEGGYAYPSVNVTSSETLNAALRGFAEAESDGIVQLSTGGAAYMSGTAIGNRAVGARALANLAHEVARESRVRVALHTDHCPPEQLDPFLRPLLEESLRRRERGGAAPVQLAHVRRLRAAIGGESPPLVGAPGRLRPGGRRARGRGRCGRRQ